MPCHFSYPVLFFSTVVRCLVISNPASLYNPNLSEQQLLQYPLINLFRCIFLIASLSSIIFILCPEIIEWFLEGQAFLRPYDSAPRPITFPPLPLASCLSISVFLCVAGQAFWQEGGGCGQRPYKCQAQLIIWDNRQLSEVFYKIWSFKSKENIFVLKQISKSKIDWKRQQIFASNRSTYLRHISLYSLHICLYPLHISFYLLQTTEITVQACTRTILSCITVVVNWCVRLGLCIVCKYCSSHPLAGNFLLCIDKRATTASSRSPRFTWTFSILFPIEM